MLVFKRLILLMLAGVGAILSGFKLYYNNLPADQEVFVHYNVSGPVVEVLYNNSSGCAEAILWNNSENTLKSLYAEVYTDKDILIFETTMLPPFSRVLLQARNGEQAKSLNIRDVIVYSDSALASTDSASVQVNLESSDELLVLNNSNKAASLDVYIKPWIESGELFTGDTEKIVIRNLQPGDTVCVPAPHMQYKLVFIDQK